MTFIHPVPAFDVAGRQLRAGARAVRGVVHVHVDIAPEDLDFTLRMLIAQQADAVIGPVARRLRVGPKPR